MRPALQIVSVLALVATIAPSVLFFTRTIELDPAKTVMLAATIVWYIATPLWMGRGESQAHGVEAK